MRLLMIASAGLGVVAAVPAEAQQSGPGASYAAPGATSGMTRARPVPRMHVAPPVRAGGRWGSKVNGRWWGGVNAPGGYSAYRRPVRGYALPGYWVSPRFHVTDWQSYGLAQPPVGYNWARYYDDAVLIDQRGSVYDTEYSVDWDRDGGGYRGDAMAQAGPDDADYYPERHGAGRDDGLGGAAIGAVAGGVLGNVVAGRGNRLGGTLIGAGVGGAAGYVIDRNEDRGRRASPVRGGGDRYYGDENRDGYGAGYPEPGYDGPGMGGHGGYGQEGGYVSRGAHTTLVPAGASHTVFVGPGVTTVTVQTQPVVTTTTTTEYYDEAVTYSHPAKRVYRKKAYRTKLKPRCNC
jgi:Ni/Co efflux regulator RcnB